MPSDALLECLPPQLRYKRVPLAAESNALGPLREAISRYQKFDYESEGASGLYYGCTEEETPAEPTEEDWRQINAWIAANEEAIALLDDGLARGRLQLPSQERQSLDAPLIGWFTIDLRDLGRLVRLRRTTASEQSDIAATVAETVRQLRLSGLILQGEGGVIDMQIGTSLLRSALESVCAATQTSNVSPRDRQELKACIASLPDIGEAAWSAYRIDLCEYGLSTLSLTRESNDAKILVDSLLPLFYESGEWVKSFATDILEEQPPSDAILQQREQQRRRLLESLLADHPRLFDRQATARLMGDITLANLQQLGQPETPMPVSRWQITEWFRRRFRPDLDEQLEDAWPYALMPSYELAAFGDDEAARSKRVENAQLFSECGNGIAALNLEMPTERQLAKCRKLLRRIDNPVGRMIAHNLAATAMPQTLLDPVERELSEAKQALRMAAA
jgi:hypothetical protein